MPLRQGAQRLWKHANRKLHHQVNMEQLRRGVLDGTIPLDISDTRTTSSAGMEGYQFIKTNELSRNISQFPNGSTVR